MGFGSDTITYAARRRNHFPINGLNIRLTTDRRQAQASPIDNGKGMT